MNTRGRLKSEKLLEMTPIFSWRPADMEMRNEKEVITRMMNLGGEARRLTCCITPGNGGNAGNKLNDKEKKCSM